MYPWFIPFGNGNLAKAAKKPPVSGRLCMIGCFLASPLGLVFRCLALSGADAPALPKGEPRACREVLASPLGRGVTAGDGEGEPAEKPLSRLRRQLSYKGEARRQMRVLDFCGRFAYNEITKEDRVPNFWTHEQTESPLGTANTEGASCLPGVSVCRA